MIKCISNHSILLPLVGWRDTILFLWSMFISILESNHQSSIFDFVLYICVLLQKTTSYAINPSVALLKAIDNSDH